MVLVQTLQDDFNAPSPDLVRWPGSFGTISQPAQRARVECGAGFSGYQSASAYTFTGSSALCQIFPPAAGGAIFEAYGQMLIRSSTVGTDALIAVNAATGNVEFLSRVSFIDPDPVFVAYNPLFHRWVRMHERQGTLFFETASDGFSWSVQRSIPTPAWMAATDLNVQLLSHRDAGVTDFAEFDNFNVTTSAYSLRVDWGSDGSFSDTDDDVTPDVLDGGRWSFGRGRDQNRQLSPSSIGQAAFTVCNADRLYSPENTSSPLVNDLGAARNVAMDTSIDGVPYALFRGKIDDFDVHPDRSNRTVDFTALDGTADLANTVLSTALYEGLRTGEIIDVILDESGWTAPRNIDMGASYARFWWEEGTDALTAVASIVRAEGPPAIAFVEADGTFVFQDRHHRLLSPESLFPQAEFSAGRVSVCPPVTGSVLVTGSAPVTGLSYTEPFGYQHGWRDIINTFSQDVPERQVDGLVTEVWTTDSPFSILTGQTIEVKVQASDPFVNAVVPVLGTDLFTTGTGVVSATLDRDSGQSVTIRLTSVGGPATVTLLRLRAQSIPISRTVTVTDSDPGSVSLNGTKTYPDSIQFVTANDVFGVSQAILSNYADRRPTVQIRVVPCDDAHLRQIVTRTISDQITIINGELGLNSGFTIESVAHVISRIPGEDDCDDRLPFHTVVFGCEKLLDDCGGNPFTFDKTGAGFDDGTFDPLGCSDPGAVWIWDTQSQFDVNTFAV